MNIKEVVDRIIEDGKITIKEHKKFIRIVHEDNKIDAFESKQIVRLLKMIENGELKLI